jgi:quercetin dioxygenase-like cupin family protein
MVEPRQLLIKASDMESSDIVPGASLRFVRGERHGLGVTISITTYPPGTGASEHRHPEGQVFIVFEGRGVYAVEGVDVVAEAGDLVVVPPNALHGFRADDHVSLRHVGLFDDALTLFR